MLLLRGGKGGEGKGDRETGRGRKGSGKRKGR